MPSPFQLRRDAQDAIADIPALIAAADSVAAHILQGAHDRKKSGGHENFWQYRDYENSDRPQDIDWRQSAKHDRVFVKEKELQTPQSTYIWCQRNASMTFQSDAAAYSKLDAARVLSLSLALLYQRGDEHVGFLAQEKASRAGISDAALERLAGYLMEEDVHPLPAAQAPRHSQIIFCGDFLAPLEDIEAAFLRYSERHRQAIVLHILDPAEIALPYSGHVIFEGTGNTRQKVEQVGGVRDAYQARMTAHLEALKALSERMGWDYILHRTDMDLQETLLSFRDLSEVRR